ncbi:hypothetical protein CIB48_g4168 [Xylaria polymorpha]|nr:hypothetical protein CIB48_g4168 [Xylaria polymorpha]
MEEIDDGSKGRRADRSDDADVARSRVTETAVSIMIGVAHDPARAPLSPFIAVIVAEHTDAVLIFRHRAGSKESPSLDHTGHQSGVFPQHWIFVKRKLKRHNVLVCGIVAILIARLTAVLESQHHSWPHNPAGIVGIVGFLIALSTWVIVEEARIKVRLG